MSDILTLITSHKSSSNKENVPPRTPTSSKSPGDCSSSPLRLKAPRVIFAAHNRHHPYAHNPRQLPSSKMSRQPAKSILKQPSHTFLPPSSPGAQREVSPEPEEDALSHARYFASPLASITASLEEEDGSAVVPITQHTLIQAYSALSLRLRTQFKAGKPVPTMDPLPPALATLKHHSSDLTRAILRDLRRPLLPPKSTDSETSTGSEPSSDDTDSSPSSDSALSSSPITAVQSAAAAKKHGVSAEEITFARDTFLLTQSVIRVCAVIISCELLHSLFETDQLSQILDSLLDIPLAERLFLPNARKTTMLSMWALQHQHLSQAIVEPSVSKFINALERAITGKLGKEGKKGAGCEALTAVQSQCSRYPSIFLPYISPLLRIILDTSLSTANFRLRSPQALGGIALGIIKWQQDAPSDPALVEARDEISHTVTRFFAVPSSATTAASKTASPSGPLAKAILEGFSRADNDLDDAPDMANSPQWALSVLTPIVVMSRDALFKSPHGISCALESLRKGVSSKNKAQVKTTTRLWWCSVVWAASLPSATSGRTWDDRGIWKVVRQVKASPVNVSIVCSLLYNLPGQDAKERMRKVEMAVGYVGDLVSENQQTGVYILKKLLSSCGVSSRPGSPVKGAKNFIDETTQDWVPDRLVASALLDGTILNTEWKSLGTVTKDILANGDVCSMDDVPPLSATEIRNPEIFAGLVGTWEEVVSKIVFQREDESAIAPLIVFTIWNQLLHSQVRHCDDAAMQCISNSLTSFIIPVHQYPKLQDPDAVDQHVVALTFVKGLWTLTRNILGPFTSSTGDNALARIPHALLDSLLDVTDLPVHTNPTLFGIWVDLVGDVLIHSTEERLIRLTQDMVWEDDVSREMWKRLGRIFASAGGEDDVERKDSSGDCLALMGVPFSELAEDPVTIRGKETWGCWEMLLDAALDKATSSNMSKEMVLARAASMLTNCGAPDPQTTLLAASYIISRIHFRPDMSTEEILTTVEPLMFIDRLLLKFGQGGDEVVDAVLKLFETLQDVVTRAVQSDRESQTLEEGSAGVVGCALEAILQGACFWLDWSKCESNGVSATQYNSVLMSFYSASLEALKCLPPSMDLLHQAAPLLVCVFDNYPPPGLGVVAFTNWWTEHYNTLVVADEDQYPEIMKPVLRALITSSEDFVVPGLSLGSEPDSQISIADRETVEESHSTEKEDPKEIEDMAMPVSETNETGSGVPAVESIVALQGERVVVGDSPLSQQGSEESEELEEEYGLDQAEALDLVKDLEEFERLYGDGDQVVVPDSQIDPVAIPAIPSVSSLPIPQTVVGDHPNSEDAVSSSLEVADLAFAQERDVDDEGGCEVGLIFPPQDATIMPSEISGDATADQAIDHKTNTTEVVEVREISLADASMKVAEGEQVLLLDDSLDISSEVDQPQGDAGNISVDSVESNSEMDDVIEARLIDDSLEMVGRPWTTPVKRKHDVQDEPSSKKPKTVGSLDSFTSPSSMLNDEASAQVGLSSPSIESPSRRNVEASQAHIDSNLSTPETSRALNQKTSSSKRPRYFLQCVELPPVKPIIRRSWSSQGPSSKKSVMTVTENDVFSAEEHSPTPSTRSVKGALQRPKATVSESLIRNVHPLKRQMSFGEAGNGSSGSLSQSGSPAASQNQTGSSRAVIDLVMESFGTQADKPVRQAIPANNATSIGSDDFSAQFVGTIMSSNLKPRSSLPKDHENEAQSPIKEHVDRRRQLLRTESMPANHDTTTSPRPQMPVRTQSLSVELQRHLQQAIAYKDATKGMEAESLVELSRLLSELTGEVNTALADLAMRRSPKDDNSDTRSG